MASLMGDIGSMLGTSNTGNIAKNSTSRANNTELNMDDFLQLMIVQLTNQTIDDAMDTSEMMNQMLQMQMITAMSNMNDISVQSYANSLVGKLVTVGILENNVLEERELYVMGTGTFNGQQVIFCNDGNMYYLSQIMAVGMLPNADGSYGSGDTDDPSGEGPSFNGESMPNLDPDFGVDHDVVVKPHPDLDPDFGVDHEPNPEYDGSQGADTND